MISNGPNMAADEDTPCSSKHPWRACDHELLMLWWETWWVPTWDWLIWKHTGLVEFLYSDQLARES